MWWKIVLIVLSLVAAAIVAALTSSWRQANQAREAFEAVASAAVEPLGRFDPAMIETLPEPARRYFLHSIASGTPLRTTVRLRMTGTFLLGDRQSSQAFAMTADQILAPPDQFVWIPVMRSGAMTIGGSDGLVDGRPWTRFWINGVLPVVNLEGGEGLHRAALTRPAMEAIWSPASLLPSAGVAWEQTGPDTVRIVFPTPIEPVQMTLDDDGAIKEISTMRWSDANPEKTFKLQPFGGVVEAEQSFEGFTIPSRVKIGNHFGTEDYLPFFQAAIVSAEYLPED
jgi:hypothetical protein